MSKVYLAGPISGLTLEGCTDWRDQVRDAVHPSIQTLSPLRGKQYLAERCQNGSGTVEDSYEDMPLCSKRGINTRDHWDATRCDVIFVNFLGAKRVSIGTVMEIAWAYTRQIPVIIVMEKEGNLHEHSMLSECTGFRVETLEQGVDVLEALLLTDQQMKEQRPSYPKTNYDIHAVSSNPHGYVSIAYIP
jgi:nucleoside 2-deoxyribosyltransferase